MDTITRNVSDIERDERHALEHFIGKQLNTHQKVIVQVVTVENHSVGNLHETDTFQAVQLPDWCNVYDGLNDEQLAEVVLKRSNLTCPS